jgi:hypothetical protein
LIFDNVNQEGETMERYFEISISDRYVRLPFIGAGHYGVFGWVWDWWSKLRRIDRAWEAKREAYLAELDARAAEAAD